MANDMANYSIGSIPTIFRTLESTIYALKSRWVENTLPQSDVPQFGNGHYTFDMLWYAHRGYADGSGVWDGARLVGNDWIFDQVVPGGSGRFYAVEGDGDLLWYDHLGSVLGTRRWAGPRQVGRGWHISTLNPAPQDFLGIFCDTRNGNFSIASTLDGTVIYAVRADGTLCWFRHDGFVDGTPAWANEGQPTIVGHGWVAGYIRVFSGCNGIIYLIGDDGILRWYRHIGSAEGTDHWEGPVEVGNGWGDFHNVFSIGGGIIYAIDNSGALLWYKHKGFKDGTVEWEGPKQVGTGWKSDGFHVVCNSVYLKPQHLG